jgi:hypothetical protein
VSLSYTSRLVAGTSGKSLWPAGVRQLMTPDKLLPKWSIKSSTSTSSEPACQDLRRPRGRSLRHALAAVTAQCAIVLLAV